MIHGQASADREAVIPVLVLDHVGHTHQVEAAIDTGFTEYLTLPPDLITRFGLWFQGRARMVLGDGTRAVLRQYGATVVWDGEERVVLVLETSGSPLVGVGLLYGTRMALEFVDGGQVIVERIA